MLDAHKSAFRNKCNCALHISMAFPSSYMDYLAGQLRKMLQAGMALSELELSCDQISWKMESYWLY